MKRILVGLAILAVSTSAALAAKKHHAMKPAAAAAAPAPVVWPGTAPTAADHALYVKNLHDSGMKK